MPVHPFLGRFRQIVHAPSIMVEDGSSTRGAPRLGGYLRLPMMCHGVRFRLGLTVNPYGYTSGQQLQVFRSLVLEPSLVLANVPPARG